MTSSEEFQHHFSIISKFVCFYFFVKKIVAFTLISFAVCTEMRWLFISSTAIWVTGSDTGSVAMACQLTKSKCEWTRTRIQNIDETSQHLGMPSNANQIKIEHNVFPAFVIKMPDGLPRIQLRDLPILDFVSSNSKVISTYTAGIVGRCLWLMVPTFHLKS